MKSLQDLLTFSKCLGRLTSEVQSTYNTEHCWKQKICTNTQTLTDTCFKDIYLCLQKKKKKAITCWNQWSPAFNTDTCLIFLEMNIEFFKTRLFLTKKSEVLVAKAKQQRWCQNCTDLVLSKQFHVCCRGTLHSCFYFLSRKAFGWIIQLVKFP